MDRLTRKELKSDRFALEVQHSVEYVSGHRRQLIQWGGIAAAVVLVILAVFLYRKHEHGLRQEALRAALRIQNANVGPAGNEFVLAYGTAAEKEKALVKAFTDITVKYPGSDEAVISEYALGSDAADQGNLADAEKRFKQVVDSGNAPYGSLAKLSLAEVYAAQGKEAEGEKTIQSVIDKPTVLVSKDEATIALAQLIGKSDPQRVRKLLEPLRGSPRNNVSQAAINALSDLSQK